ncbi:MAG TPA: glycogen synthase GlgA [Bryobacteraceae bacterium]|nr:glycogen synthase GlgA [Bryobacteraceae bacterium]
MEGYLALILHAHLPYVRHLEHKDFLEENWLFEAITETYIPLFLILDDLLSDGIDFRLTISLTPTLASMLLDPPLQARYLKKLERTIELAEKEVDRTASEPDFQALSLLYHQRFLRVHDAFVNRYGRNLVGVLDRFRKTGKVEVIASAATHGYLPLLSVNPSAVRAQVRLGVEHYQQIFGTAPNGFWLPECGYYPGVDEFLCDNRIRYTILETHGITRADHRPNYGVYAPLACPSGVAVFGRDPDSSRQVWSSEEGYPGDFDYREFYRDIGFDLDLDYIGPYIHPDEIRIDTGIKYYRITGKGVPQEPYVPEWAERKAAIHAEHFLSERIKQVVSLAAGMDRKPIVVAPYDAELFGHWWFEGPRWLDYLIRRIALDQSTIRLITLSEYLDEYQDNQVATPSFSSWGRNGFNEVWLNGENDWIYPHLQAGAEMVEQLSAASTQATGLALRALNQAGRELLLAQSSDWAFMINSGEMKNYATERTKSHLLRLHSLSKQLETGSIDEALLCSLEDQDHLFPDLSVIDAFRQIDTKATRSEARVPKHVLPTVSARSSLDIAMVTPELVPFAKTGGLADMVSALSAALRKLGHRPRVFMPAWRGVLEKGIAQDTGIRLRVPTAEGGAEVTLLCATLENEVPVYLIRCDHYFDRPFLYGTPEGDYADNAKRFAFFARGVLEALGRLGAPHILHAHDWQAAPAVAFLKAQPELYPALSSVPAVLTIHNLGYQGLFPPEDWSLLGLDQGLFTFRHLEFYGKVNFLKGGLAFADAISTVSPSYSREIQTAEYGFGLDGFLRERARTLTGILNGVDYKIWSPQNDQFLARTYSPQDLSGKRSCKSALQEAFGLTKDADIAILGIVSRLVSQKGLDLVQAVFADLMQRDVQLVVLGTGDRSYQDYLVAAALRNPEKVGVRIGFDERLAHQIEAGADMFLMPSLYEPSGLNQLYSLKYGTIPIVRATGGLKDSVVEFNAETGRGNGFVFEAYEASGLLSAIDRALALFKRKDQWKLLMRAAMAADHSWDQSAREYLKLYATLLPAGVTPNGETPSAETLGRY